MKDISLIKDYKKRKRHLNYYILYTLCFIMMLFCILMPFMIEGISLIMAADGYNYSFPSLAYVRNYIINFFHGGGLPEYDWGIGYGENVIYSLSWSGFGNPFALFMAFFPTEYLAYGFSFVSIIKLYVSGLSCSYYLKKKRYNDYVILAVTMLYTFSAFSLLRAIQHFPFLDPMISFPLIIGGVEEYTEENISIRLIIGVFFQSLCGFYFLYIELLLAAIYFVILSLCGKSSLLEFIKSGCKCLGAVLLGIGLGLCILFPSIVGFLKCSRFGGSSAIEYPLFDLKNVTTYLKNMFIPTASTVYTIPICGFILLIKGFMDKRMEKGKKVMLSIMIFGLFIPIFGSLLNGFSAVDNARWSFAIHFFVGIIVADELQNEKEKTNKILLLLTFAIVILNVLSILFETEKDLMLSKSIVCVCYILLFSYICLGTKNRKEICFTIIINILLNGIVMTIPVSFGGLQETSKYLSYEQIERYLEREFSVQVSKLDDEHENFRIDVAGDNLNIGLYSGQAGCTEYLSILNKNLHGFYSEYGLMPVAGTAKYLLRGLDNRAILEDIFSVKYYGINSVNSEVENEIVENRNYCNLGLVYDKYFSLDDFKEMSMLEKQSALTQGVILEEESAIEHADKVEYTEIMVPYEMQTEGNIKINGSYYNVEDGSQIILELSENDYASMGHEMYVHIKQAELVPGTAETNVPKISINGKQVMIADNTYTYWTGETEVWLNTPIDENNRVQILFPSSGTYLLDDIEVYFYNIEEQEKNLEILDKNSFKNQKIGVDRIEGIVEEGDNRVLALALPFEEGWTATINGEKKECIRVNNGLLGVYLQSGLNEICFSYSTPGRQYYTMASCLCWILFCYIAYLQKNKRNFMYIEGH